MAQKLMEYVTKSVLLLFGFLMARAKPQKLNEAPGKITVFGILTIQNCQLGGRRPGSWYNDTSKHTH